MICNVCAGHRANEALGRVLSILASARYGTTVGMEIDAYRIFLHLPGAVRAPEVKETLLGLEPAHIAAILELAMKRTVLYKWKLVQIAKKFGAIDADADYERISIHRLTEVFDRTVVQREAFRELFSVYMDVGTAGVVVGELREGISEILTGPVSILGAEGLFSSKDQIAPPTVDQAVISTLKRRLDQQEIVFCCMNCRRWKSRTQVGRAPEHPECPKCHARLVAVLKPWEEELCAVIAKKKKTEDERRIERRLLKNANIVLSSGRKAVVALAASGVGPDTASRILGTLTEDDAFYREILKAERNYIRTHRYW